ncbi:hypothetical protein LDENG_00233700 [Lucifuga dentata]|nr:hypothetical protein LDENG_00233700 [Lucifuga dentata]
MARVCLLAFTAGFLLHMYTMVSGVPEENTGSVFVSQQSADMVLRRQRRHNSGFFEELSNSNLERECMEEKCTIEEAREVFEDDEKTMEFWASYIDGNQCDSSPCQNGGVCKDGINTYVCWCNKNFIGKNCEIEVTKLCSVDNGGCSHFCVTQSDHAVCRCAAGYKLGADKRSCEPTEQFSCGVVNVSTTSNTRSIINVRSSNRTHTSEMDYSSSDTVWYEYDDLTAALQYDVYDLSTNDSDVLNKSVASAVKPHSMKSDDSSGVTLTEVVMNDDGASSVTEAQAGDTMGEKQQAFFTTLPTDLEKDNEDKRIVGGNEAIPGEIPWQVSLMTHSEILRKSESFCGGSLLSDLWVITAAHCLTSPRIVRMGFFVRVGEHDLDRDEGTERDYSVAEQFIHKNYDERKSPYNHDIALLKLSSPVELSNRRRPICLGPSGFTIKLVEDSSRSVVSGWGALNFQGAASPKLQKLEVPHVDRGICKASSSERITRFMFCAGYKSEAKDSCQGDSGGPHATKHKDTWFLTGIVSWGEECAKDGKYGIYTYVAKYYKWINNITGIQISK